MTMGYKFSKVKRNSIRKSVLKDIRELLRLLDPKAPSLKKNDFLKILRSNSTKYYTVADTSSRKVVAMMTLVFFRAPTGLKARVEDIVVQPSHRRKGVGEKLIRVAIHESGRKGAVSLDLTSSPTRQNANKLYRKLGFSKRRTNVYRYELAKV